MRNKKKLSQAQTGSGEDDEKQKNYILSLILERKIIQ